MLTVPLRQQTAALAKASGRRNFAFFMEQGTGKTWVALAEAEAFFAAGEIDALLIVALKGVHRNWIVKEIPEHLSVPHVSLLWNAGRMETRAATAALEVMHRPAPTLLKIVAMNVEAFSRSPSPARTFAEYFLHRHRVMIVADESDTIKTPSATRTRVLWALARRSRIRRILTGTPLTESPLDAYSQFKFLDVTLLGQPNFATFKAHFGHWVTRTTKTGQSWVECVRYKHLDELKTLIDANSYTVRKVDCLDLPPKVPQIRPVELPLDTLKLYSRVKKELVVQLRAGQLTLRNAMTRLLRLQQITGGFLPLDSGELEPLPGRNPKIESLVSYMHDLPGDVRAIVWCRFRAECHAVVAALGERAVRYWGDISNDERGAAVTAFQDPSTAARYFVGTARAGGRGLDLTAATQVLYFSNSYSAADRQQSEDRPHRIGQRNRVTYTDLLAVGTIDEKIYEMLAAKKTLAELFKGKSIEALIDWLEAQ